MELHPGTTVLERYVIDRPLGVGGMGRVYAARHATLGFPVAVKVLAFDNLPGLHERFELEAKLMARVRHPNVVLVQDYGFLESSVPCIVMEYLEGESLEERLGRQGPLPWPEAVAVLRGLLAGLGALHHAAVIHRDLKPSNIFLVRGPPESVKLIDLGIARSLAPQASRLTRTGMLMGTPDYMAPEQLVNSGVDHRADLFAAGLILYETLSGMVPLAGDDFEALMRRLTVPIGAPLIPAELPPVPDALLDVMQWLLQIQPSKRPADAGDALARLDEALDERRRDPGARPSAPRGPVRAAFALGETPIETLAPARVRFLVAAKLPPSVLARREERRFLAAVAGAEARGFTYGAQFWFALQSDAGTEAEARRRVEAITRALASRFGAHARVAWRAVDKGFALSPAALTGTAPLPPPLRELLDGLLAPPR